MGAPVPMHQLSEMLSYQLGELRRITEIIASLNDEIGHSGASDSEEDRAHEQGLG